MVLLNLFFESILISWSQNALNSESKIAIFCSERAYLATLLLLTAQRVGRDGAVVGDVEDAPADPGDAHGAAAGAAGAQG